MNTHGDRSTIQDEDQDEQKRVLQTPEEQEALKKQDMLTDAIRKFVIEEELINDSSKVQPKKSHDQLEKSKKKLKNLLKKQNADDKRMAFWAGYTGYDDLVETISSSTQEIKAAKEQGKKEYLNYQVESLIRDMPLISTPDKQDNQEDANQTLQDIIKLINEGADLGAAAFCAGYFHNESVINYLRKQRAPIPQPSISSTKLDEIMSNSKIIDKAKQAGKKKSLIDKLETDCKTSELTDKPITYINSYLKQINPNKEEKIQLLRHIAYWCGYGGTPTIDMLTQGKLFEGLDEEEFGPTKAIMKAAYTKGKNTKRNDNGVKDDQNALTKTAASNQPSSNRIRNAMLIGAGILGVLTVALIITAIVASHGVGLAVFAPLLLTGKLGAMASTIAATVLGATAIAGIGIKIYRGINFNKKMDNITGKDKKNQSSGQEETHPHLQETGKQPNQLSTSNSSKNTPTTKGSQDDKEESHWEKKKGVVSDHRNSESFSYDPHLNLSIKNNQYKMKQIIHPQQKQNDGGDDERRETGERF